MVFDWVCVHARGQGSKHPARLGWLARVLIVTEIDPERDEIKTIFAQIAFWVLLYREEERQKVVKGNS